jgi:uncharacterized repeat protein (TIGR01451 family)
LRYWLLPAALVVSLILERETYAQAQTPAIPVANAPGSPPTNNPGSSPESLTQTPTLQVEKVGPTTLNIGKPLRYEIVTRNAGSTPVLSVQVEEQIPAGARFISAEPRPMLRSGLLIWNLGNLDPGVERRIKIELQPVGEGELDSRATVTFSANSNLHTRITRPRLTLAKTGPSTVQVGQPAVFQLVLSNVGSGPATGVMLHDHLPEGLRHPNGPEVETDIGTLQPGENKTITLETTAVKPGRFINQAVASGEDGLQALAQVALVVTQPMLTLAKAGPKRLFLGRVGEFHIEVGNPGSAPAMNVQVIDTLPPEFEFVEAGEGGKFDPATRGVTWNLGALPAGQKQMISVKGLAKGAGDPINEAVAHADGGLEAKASLAVHLEGVPALLLEVVDLEDPIEVGAETTYEIRVVNQGTSATTNLQIIATVPDGMTTRDATGPALHRLQGHQVIFEKLPSLAAKADALYRVKVVGDTPGDMRFKVQMTSDQLRSPVYEEESTRVYKD